MKREPEWGEFLKKLEGIKTYADRAQIEAKSKDYYWYSPILTEEFEGRAGDLVVLPANQDEVRRIAAAVAEHKIPLTVRGGGTGNYGQCVPLEGGIIMETTRLNKVISIGRGSVRVEAGARISALNDAVRATGQELLMYPSTHRIATIGGFLAGGSGGIGSLRHGMLRDDGNVGYLRIMTIEKEPRIIELKGHEIQKTQHAYGTNGIILELELALTAATDWVHTAALFPDYKTALRFAMAAQGQDLDCYMLTVVDRRFSPYYRKFGAAFPPDRDAVFAMVAPEAVERFDALVRSFSGRVSVSMTRQELHAAGLPPADECGWNHTTLQALKVDKSWTYLQVGYPGLIDPDLVERQIARYGDEMFMHHEMARMGDEVFAMGIPLVKYRGRERMLEVMRELEEVDNCIVYNPHTYLIEDGGMKEIDTQQIDFKRLADPHGLMNPGKTRGWTADMAVA